MKKRWISLLLICCFLFALTPGKVMASNTQIMQMQNWNQWNLEPAQANAYANAIEKAITRNAKFNLNNQEVTRSVYATLFNIDNKILLWIAGISMENREREWPLEIAYGTNRCFEINFEEVWEWNGTQAVKFAPLSDYDAVYANLRPEGLEIFTNYGGTDVDGEAFDALYPISNGKISTMPDWCRAWMWLYEYKLEDAKISMAGKSQKELAETYINYLNQKHIWPVLPFDWNTLKTEYDANYIEISNGTGWSKYYPEISKKEHSFNFMEYWPVFYNGNLGGTLLSASDIADQDGRWSKSEDMIAHLKALGNSSGFSDVLDSDWFAESVKWAVENKITAGTSEIAFSPRKSCTRAQILTFLWRANGSPMPSTGTSCPFSDVKSNAYYYDAVRWAVEHGILAIGDPTATGDFTALEFAPDKPCSRVQAVTFLYLAAGSPAVSSQSAFQDVPQNNYAVSWAVQNGITSGTSDTTFSPDKICNRAEILTFLYRSATK